MQVSIKTAEEFRDAHVTIEIKADRSQILELLRDQVEAQVQGSSSDWAADRLRDKVHQLEHSLALRVAEIEELETQAAGDAGTIEGLRGRIGDLEADISRRVENAVELEAHQESLRASRDEWRAKFEDTNTRLVQVINAKEMVDGVARAERRRAGENRRWAEKAEDLLSEQRQVTESQAQVIADISARLAKVQRLITQHADDPDGNLLVREITSIVNG